MPHFYTPGLLDRLLDDGAAPGWTLDQLKEGVARDLEALLNTRFALPDGLLAPFPEAQGSLAGYGLADFAGMCMNSDADQQKICDAVKLAIERHEPRLRDVSARLRLHASPINRIDFAISARLKAQLAGEIVHFDAMLEPSSQQYVIRRTQL
ncbi:MAG: type VI secretion system baseplate subunit TssE [Pseudomonadota bacterium]